jgi:hypothetical protein
LTNVKPAQNTISTSRHTTVFKAQFVRLTIMSSTTRSGSGRTDSKLSPMRSLICSLVLRKPFRSLPQRTMPILHANVGVPTSTRFSKAYRKVVRLWGAERRTSRNKSWPRTRRQRRCGMVALVANSRTPCFTCNPRHVLHFPPSSVLFLFSPFPEACKHVAVSFFFFQTLAESLLSLSPIRRG